MTCCWNVDIGNGHFRGEIGDAPVPEEYVVFPSFIKLAWRQYPWAVVGLNTPAQCSMTESASLSISVKGRRSPVRRIRGRPVWPLDAGEPDRQLERELELAGCALRSGLAGDIKQCGHDGVVESHSVPAIPSSGSRAMEPADCELRSRIRGWGRHRGGRRSRVGGADDRSQQGHHRQGRAGTQRLDGTLRERMEMPTREKWLIRASFREFLRTGFWRWEL